MATLGTAPLPTNLPTALPTTLSAATALSDPGAPSAAGFAAASRAVMSVAVELITGVQRAVSGPDNVRTARDNAWAAMLADRAANEARAELTREVAALVATRSDRRPVGV